MRLITALFVRGATRASVLLSLVLFVVSSVAIPSPAQALTAFDIAPAQYRLRGGYNFTYFPVTDSVNGRAIRFTWTTPNKVTVEQGLSLSGTSVFKVGTYRIDMIEAEGLVLTPDICRGHPGWKEFIKVNEKRNVDESNNTTVRTIQGGADRITKPVYFRLVIHWVPNTVVDVPVACGEKPFTGAATLPTPTPTPSGPHIAGAEYKVTKTDEKGDIHVTLGYGVEPAKQVSGLRVKVLREGVAKPVYDKAAKAQDSFEQVLKPEDDGATYTFQLIQNNKVINSVPLVVNLAEDSGTAAGTTAGKGLPTPDPCKQTGATYEFCNTLFGPRITAMDYYKKAYYWAVAVAILGATAMIIWAGYKYVTSRGNPAEMGNAKEMIISALVGLGLLVLSFAILRFLGINITSP